MSKKVPALSSIDQIMRASQPLLVYTAERIYPFLRTALACAMVGAVLPTVLYAQSTLQVPSDASIHVPSNVPINVSINASMHQINTINATDLNALIVQAVHTHPLVGAAAAEKQATKHGITAAKLNFWPTPSLSTQFDHGQLITQARIRQPLWSGGRLSASVNQAVYDDKAAQALIFERQNTVAKDTIDIWQNYVYAIALQDLYRQSLMHLDEFKQMMQRRVAQGVSARIELDLINNRILQDQNAFSAAAEQENIAKIRLMQMTGLEPVFDAPVALEHLAQYVKQNSTQFSAQMFTNLGHHNPSVLRADHQVLAAQYEAKASKASYYPTIYAQYEHTYNHKTHKNDSEFLWALSYEPGAGLSNMALSAASDARTQSLIHNKQALLRTAIENMQTQYQQFASSRDKELSLVAAVAGAQIVSDSYRRQFVAGKKSWLEVLNALKEHAQYEQELIQTRAQMVANFYKLQVDLAQMPWQHAHAQAADFTQAFAPIKSFGQWLKTVRIISKSSDAMVDDADNISDDISTYDAPNAIDGDAINANTIHNSMVGNDNP